MGANMRRVDCAPDAPVALDMQADGMWRPVRLIKDVNEHLRVNPSMGILFLALEAPPSRQAQTQRVSPPSQIVRDGPKSFVLKAPAAAKTRRHLKGFCLFLLAHSADPPFAPLALLSSPPFSLSSPLLSEYRYSPRGSSCDTSSVRTRASLHLYSLIETLYTVASMLLPVLHFLRQLQGFQISLTK